MAEVAGEVCGIQAQLMSAAELALRARVRRLLPGEVRKALWKDRTLVKTWFVRGAVHLIPSADLGSFLGALQPREPRMLAFLHSNGLSRREAEAIVGEIVALLRDGPLIRRELAERVGERLGAKARRWVASPWGVIVRLACARGLVCFGPEQGNEVTFVRLEDWLPRSSRPEPDEAARILLNRYLSAFGPATPADYVLWTNLLVSDVRKAWRGIEGDLEETQIDGRRGFVLREDLKALNSARFSGSAVRLLPNFDPLLLGHRDKAHLVDKAHYKRVYRKAGWIYPSIFVNGRIEGTWSLARRARASCVEVEMFHAPSAGWKEGIASEVEDIGRFLGVECELAFR